MKPFTNTTAIKIPKFLAIILVVLLASPLDVFGQTAEELLDPDTQDKWQIELPRPARIDVTRGKGRLSMVMAETSQWLGLTDETTGEPLMTTVWGYGPNERSVTYPGPTFVAMRDVPVDIRWNNNLPSSGHLLPVDVTLHMAHPHDVPAADFYAAGNVPAVVHLHGGHTESASDGLPEAWYTQGFGERGPFFVKRTYHYDNDQEAATLWYHDHALGITRLNVYAGLAGYYFLRDDHELSMTTTRRDGRKLPHPDFEYEFVIQDRSFTKDGQLILPYERDVVGELFEFPPEEYNNWPEPTAAAEFFGDHILVNGVIWPKLTVEKRKYRFRMLNGSDSRFYVLRVKDQATQFIQIGSDNGFLNNAVGLDELIIAPGERFDVVIDFSGFAAGDEIVIENYGPDEPFGGDVLDEPTEHTGQIVKFIVSNNMANLPDATVKVGTPLNSLQDPEWTEETPMRSLVLFEGMDEYGRLQPLLGTFDEGTKAWFEDITENPDLNSTEIWEVINATGDAHPIHLHLVAFRIIERQEITIDEDDPAYIETKPQVQHNTDPDDPETFGVGAVLKKYDPGVITPYEDLPDNEKGLKDTHIVLPGQKTKVIATFDRPGRYVWHCHILSHEDHEMMRPFYVGNMAVAGRTADTDLNVDQNSPNPFTTGTQIRFELKQAENVQLTVYDIAGRDILYQHMDFYQEGKHALFWDGVDKNGRFLPDGVYIYRVKGESFEDTKKLIIDR